MLIDNNTRPSARIKLNRKYFACHDGNWIDKLKLNNKQVTLHFLIASLVYTGAATAMCLLLDYHLAGFDRRLCI